MTQGIQNDKIMSESLDYYYSFYDSHKFFLLLHLFLR